MGMFLLSPMVIAMNVDVILPLMLESLVVDSKVTVRLESLLETLLQRNSETREGW